MESWKKMVALGTGAGLCAMVIAAGHPEMVIVSSPEGEEIAGDFDQPIAEGGAGSNKSSGSTTTINVVDDGVTYSATLEGNKIKSVQKDGKELKKDQYRLKNGKIEILDEDGDVEKTLPMPKQMKAMSGLNRIRVAPRAPVAPVAPGSPVAPIAPRTVVIGKAPKVMLGVTMSDADSDEMERLGVEDGEGVVLDSVAKDLPAAKAGLKANDIILEADGKKLSGQEQFREILASKSPGDVMVVKVLRKGGPQQMEIKLDAFNEGALRGFATLRRDTPDAPENEIDPEDIEEMLQDIEEQVRDQIQALRDQIDSTDWNSVRDEVSAALAESMKSLAEAREQAAQAAAQGSRWWQEHGREFTMPQGWMQLRQPTPPPAFPGQGTNEMNGKLDKLSEQLERMNKRLDEMEKQIQKK